MAGRDLSRYRIMASYILTLNRDTYYLPFYEKYVNISCFASTKTTTKNTVSKVVYSKGNNSILDI